MDFFQVWSLAVQVSQQDSSPAHWTTAMEHLDLRNVRLTGWGVGNWKRKSMLEAKLLFALFPNFGSRVQGSAGVGIRQWELALTEHVDPAIRQSFFAFCAEWKNQGFWLHLVWLRKTCSTTIAAWHSPRLAGWALLLRIGGCQTFAVRATHLCSLRSAGSWLHRVWFLLGSIVSKCLKFLKCQYIFAGCISEVKTSSSTKSSA